MQPQSKIQLQLHGERDRDIHTYVRATCGKRALHNRKSITCYLPRRTAEDADASRRRRKGSCGCGWFYFYSLDFFFFCLLRKQTNNWKPNKVLWMPMWVHSRTHWAHTRRRWRRRRLLHLHNDSSVARVSRTVHSFLSTKVAENKREFLVYYFGLGWFPQFFAYIKTRWQNDGRTRRAAATCAISWRGKRRRVARERERREKKQSRSTASTHNCRLQRSAHVWPGAERLPHSRRRERVAAIVEREQKSKRSTHTVSTIEECQWELVLSSHLYATHLTISLLSMSAIAMLTTVNPNTNRAGTEYRSWWHARRMATKFSPVKYQRFYNDFQN